jgi:hypothetical protein
MRAPHRAAVLSTLTSNEWDSKQDKPRAFGPCERHGVRARTTGHREPKRLSSIIENSPRHRKKSPSNFGPGEEARTLVESLDGKEWGTAPLSVDEDDCSPGRPRRRSARLLNADDWFVRCPGNKRTTQQAKKPRPKRTPVAAPKTRRTSCLRFRRFPLRSTGKAARPFWPRPARLRLNCSHRSHSAHRFGWGRETR